MDYKRALEYANKAEENMLLLLTYSTLMGFTSLALKACVRNAIRGVIELRLGGCVAGPASISRLVGESWHNAGIRALMLLIKNRVKD